MRWPLSHTVVVRARILDSCALTLTLMVAPLASVRVTVVVGALLRWSSSRAAFAGAETRIGAITAASAAAPVRRGRLVRVCWRILIYPSSGRWVWGVR